MTQALDELDAILGTDTLEPKYLVRKDDKGITHVQVEKVGSLVRWEINKGKMVKVFDLETNPF